MTLDDHTQPPLIELLYRQSFAVLFANLIIPFPVAYVFWGSMDQTLLIGWIGAIVALTLVRLVQALRFFQAKRIGERTGAWKSWAWEFSVLSWLTAALWGGLGWFGYSAGAPHLLAFTCIILTGLTCGAVPSLSAFPAAYIGSMVAMLLPLAVRCILGGTEIDTIYLFLIACLAGANLYYSRVTYRTLLETVRLRFDNVQLIERLGEERDRAQAADQSKTRFLAAASHDLRQPIHALSLFVSTLATLAQRGNVAMGAASHMAARMQAVVDNLGALLNGLLDVSRLDAGVIPVQRQPVALGELLAELEHAFAGLAVERGLDWRVVPSSAWVESDPALLRRMLENLVANAFRYTRQGGVLLGCFRLGASVHIAVVDSGIGIASDQREQIFEEFVQLQAGEGERQAGTGLGLAIVRRMGVLLDHPIRVRSIPGRGSVFSIAVPVAAPAQIAATSSAGAAAAATVMAIDDDVHVLEGISALLTAWGHRVLAAKDVAALQHLHGAATVNGPVAVQLILADYRLGGGVRGTEAIVALRDYLGSAVPAVIITGDTSPDRLRELVASGHAVLHKPLTAEILQVALRQALERDGVLSGLIEA